ncbi:hypothetical protein PsYK624_110270 [Phanerochaete sordida]|uniref:S5 DRBM domain-containing protein n=1 Tax=Phanerochaete sordida TaxID=48140 RepID=A0A9P3GH54_9APHY|nr:hypothetical protein PsYK624_110270 [Phanerochaete sordida]
MLRLARPALNVSRLAASSRSALRPSFPSLCAIRLNSTQTPKTPPASNADNSTQVVPESAMEGSTLLSEADESMEEEWEYEESGEDAVFPDLMEKDGILDDISFVEEFPAEEYGQPHTNQIRFRNEDPLGGKWDEEPLEDDMSVENNFEFVPVSRHARSNWHEYCVQFRRVSLQTGKGKRHRMNAMYVVGNGDGLLGFGSATDEEAQLATQKAIYQAYRNIDYVDRMEKRTLWTDMESKLGSTRVVLRPRPVGFGLRCNPYVHYILKAAGIKDASGKVWGSRSPMNVIHATLRMLWSGNAPLAMGNGIGGPGRRLMKGSGMRGAGDVERERGRRMASLRM